MVQLSWVEQGLTRHIKYGTEFDSFDYMTADTQDQLPDKLTHVFATPLQYLIKFCCWSVRCVRFLHKIYPTLTTQSEPFENTTQSNQSNGENKTMQSDL